MLRLNKITKNYSMGDTQVEALKGIDIEFRSNEFVSILGPSGCGKTTLLNIIGGLDRYTDGDLIISGRSTKEYCDADWDTYRNHSIGFVFQSYNLIPHQTVLQNVELALTLSGVSKHERKSRAKKALEDVGLGDQLNKKPGEMSGGQMQRVAIARALVNNPDIILADEPTGALDTETSVQVMEILKEISKKKLIIMVTHNPDLANKYSSRIIKMLDGVITHDSSPLNDTETNDEANLDTKRNENQIKSKKPSMSFGTSFMLSLKNLITKKGRTILTSFAGSIGIIGIALILAISHGMTVYINTVQENTLSVYPLTLEASTIDMTTLMDTFMNITAEKSQHENDAVYEKPALYDMINAMNSIEESKNDLKAFKSYLEENIKDEESDLSTAVNGIQYSYDLDMQIYTENVDGDILHSNLEQILGELMQKYIGIDMSSLNTLQQMSPASSMSSMSSLGSTLWQELLPGKNGAPINDLILEQYDVVYGAWPNGYNEVVLVLDENNEIDDLVLYALGLISSEEIDELSNSAINGTKLEEKESRKWSYEEICSTEYKSILNSDCYRYDETSGRYTDLRKTDAGLRYLYDNAMSLKITGIIKPKEDADTTMLTGSIAYTNLLTKHIINQADGSDIIKAQLKSENIDVISGLPFESSTGTLTDIEKETSFREYIDSLNDSEKIAKYIAINCIPSDDFLQQQVAATMNGMTRPDMEEMMLNGISQQVNVSKDEISEYLTNMNDEEFNEMFTEMLRESIKTQYATNVATQLSSMSPQQLLFAFNNELPQYTVEQCAKYYDEVMEFSTSSYEQNLIDMGHISLDSPASINIYASSFENKDIITESIKEYNNNVEELKQIKYTDYLGIMMSSITTIINSITYVLIAFVAISLIVSSIMIGVITLISVQERTKEIGILRAIGASKRDVSGLFNAETVIVGFASGLLGIIITYLLCIPINLILHALTGISTLNAILPFGAAVILVIISVCLTLISGIIPSRSAAKKDPVTALRSE
ncbi:MAG: ATP-binding cassette domain-containing protein [Ruminococcaceae bacterium]|nr:ATP-binding cassette domain-containing protein [Oscillospiraceae bacterium]